MLPQWVKSGAILAATTLLGTSGAFAQDNWSYSGANGPANWHTLSGANSICVAGQFQSPINIEGTEPAVMHRLRPDYKVSEINLAHNRLMITMDYERGSYLRVGKKMLFFCRMVGSV